MSIHTLVLQATNGIPILKAQFVEKSDFPAYILSTWIIIIKLIFEIPIAAYFWLNAIFKS